MLCYRLEMLENVKSKNKKEDGEGRWEVVTRPERNGGIKLF
jgi:hypothetical protein